MPSPMSFSVACKNVGKASVGFVIFGYLSPVSPQGPCGEPTVVLLSVSEVEEGGGGKYVVITSHCQPRLSDFSRAVLMNIERFEYIARVLAGWRVSFCECILSSVLRSSLDVLRSTCSISV